MPHTELLAVVERDGFVESEHRGVAVVIDPDGRVIERHGDVTLPFLAVVVVLASGWPARPPGTSRA